MTRLARRTFLALTTATVATALTGWPRWLSFWLTPHGFTDYEYLGPLEYNARLNHGECDECALMVLRHHVRYLELHFDYYIDLLPHDHSI